ncbi:hypothetical protein DLAC_09989 [Tieghemostelium lacteum]|uniref:Generative cell specific-1/HAP2 domain-containing protein n=1 Tax=Tieghemostelium lacteum TaxID=361077 RepID=A0A151Z5W4_TIELA|nr:hypothetical protein DLAC_09989 [Tieghemostelium lacteum]|eukprot:KYQ89328.1 hypothetical protein DLAC_09989 [Tieghemostelium lacteum]
MKQLNNIIYLFFLIVLLNEQLIQCKLLKYEIPLNSQKKNEAQKFTIYKMMDENNDIQSLDNPISVKFETTEVSQICSFDYEFSAPFQANEVVKETISCDNACGGIDCVRDSGFCCDCSNSDIIENRQLTRSKKSCDLFGLLTSTAHCLQFSKQMFNMFSVKECTTRYNVKVTIKMFDISLGSYRTEILNLSPSSPISSYKELQLELEGNFLPVVHFKDYSGYYISAPMDSNDPINALPYNNNTMILERNLFDKSGLSCNKIGVSYSAFQNQPKRCQSELSSCLRNQLKDYFEKGTYFIGSLGEISRVHSTTNSTSLYLSLNYPFDIKSFVKLNLVSNTIDATEK